MTLAGGWDFRTHPTSCEYSNDMQQATMERVRALHLPVAYLRANPKAPSTQSTVTRNSMRTSVVHNQGLASKPKAAGSYSANVCNQCSRAAS
jgi:hypothetical protein